MASESEQEKHETLADIAAEIREYGDRPPPKRAWLDIAERIEAIDSADAWRSLYSGPARNCDAMSRSMCTTRFSTTYEGNRDGLCDVQTEREKNIHLYYIELIDWLFAPAAERKGENDGR